MNLYSQRNKRKRRFILHQQKYHVVGGSGDVSCWLFWRDELLQCVEGDKFCMGMLTLFYSVERFRS